MITDESGIADLSVFKQDELININHSSYYPVTLTKQDMLKGNKIIYLEEKVIKIDEVVVSANKWEQPKSDVPQQMASIDAQDIMDIQPQTSADMLAATGQVFVQKSQLGGGSPMIRGFAANSVLLIVDGVRMNNAIFRSGNLQNVLNIDPLSLQSAEVIFGPGSLIYGSDALGGVMDFHTINPEFSIEGTKVSGSVSGRYSTANNEKTGHISLNIAGKKLASFTSLSYSDFDNLRAGANYPDGYENFFKRDWYVRPSADANDEIIDNPDPEKQIPSAYNQYSFIQKFKLKISDRIDAGINFYYSSTSDIPRYDRLILEDNGSPENAEWYYGPQQWMMNSIKLKFNTPTIAFDRFKLTLAYQDYEESRNDRKFQNESLRTRTENVKAYSLNADFEKNFEKWVLYYGLEYFHNDVFSDAERKNIVSGEITPSSTRYPSEGSDYLSAAAYSFAKYHLSEKLLINAGLRYTYIETTVDFGDAGFPDNGFTNKNGALTGSASFIFQPNDIHNLSISYGSGFRAPNVDDAAKVFDSEPGNVVVPNPDLEPEYNHSFEIGYKAYNPDKFTFEFAAFYSFLVNAMERRDFTFNGQEFIPYDGIISRVQAEVNVGKAQIYGLSINGSYLINDNLSLAGTLTISDGETSDGEPVRHVVPLFGRTSLKYDRSKWDVYIDLRYQGGIDFKDLAPSEQNKTHLYTEDGALGWATINLGGSVNVLNNLTINSGLENLADLHYRPYSSGISAPGRNFYFGLRYLF
ncbi:TonB-dependent receptor [Mangrovivirga cuniculi]|uniref:TonB-dependent receptor n=1 Tax=Mangrovivirga cuniculi TaxID=2715131 RepID=A0A4D7JJP6_9BACT|nr:TonB-dependent receptor [Mangrovivirga cuniculi]QCK15821.1 TonB-dependent receptor [Mangrovivirga cuniculi]